MKSKKCLAMVMAATFALGTMAFAGCKKDEDAQTPTSEIVENNMAITEKDGNGIQMLSVLLSPSEYENYGVSSSVESAHLVTASYPDDYVSNPAVDWYVEFVDGASAWATGKKASDYVTATPTEDGALTAVVACKKEFGEPIRVVCKSRQMPELTDNFICDYATKILGMNTLFVGDELWQVADVSLDGCYTDIASVINGETCENAFNLNANDIVGKYSLTNVQVDTTTTGTMLDWKDFAPWDYWVETPNVNAFIAKVDASTILTKKTNVETDAQGRARSCGVLGLPYAEYLSETCLYKIVYHWTERNGGDVSDSRLAVYDDGGVCYNEYCRIMNKLTQTAGVTWNRLTYTYSIDIGHTYQGDAVEIDIDFVISNAAEYFIVEPTGITLDTDHILFEP